MKEKAEEGRANRIVIRLIKGFLGDLPKILLLLVEEANCQKFNFI
jgi:hypothetical protein